MPYKDPDKRREYFRKYMRERRKRLKENVREPKIASRQHKGRVVALKGYSGYS